MTDSILKDHLQNATVFASYTSNIIQNELILICGELIQENKISKFKATKYFSILVDETQNISRLEQMSICVRMIPQHIALRKTFSNLW